jgi:hypothetical protein
MRPLTILAAIALLLPAPARVQASRAYAGGTDAISFGATTTTDIHTVVSVCAWVMMGNAATGGKIISHGDRSSPSPLIEWNLRLTTAGKASMETANGSVVGATTLTINVWTALCGVWNGSTVAIYVNGTSDATPVAVTGPLTHTVNNTVIGNSAAFAANGHVGRIAEVTVWGGNIGAFGATLYAGRSPGPRIEPGSVRFYAPLYGQATEPNYYESSTTFFGAVTGTNIAPHPGVNR